MKYNRLFNIDKSRKNQYIYYCDNDIEFYNSILSNLYSESNGNEEYMKNEITNMTSLTILEKKKLISDVSQFVYLQKYKNIYLFFAENITQIYEILTHLQSEYDSERSFFIDSMKNTYDYHPETYEMLGNGYVCWELRTNKSFDEIVDKFRLICKKCNIEFDFLVNRGVPMEDVIEE
jgi:hypothetical protein